MKKIPAKLVQVVSLSVASYPLAFVNQMLLGYYFGTSAEMDAYWLGMTIVTTMGFFVQPAREAIVPEFYKRREKDRHEGDRYCSEVGNFMLLALLAFSAAVAIFPRPLARIVSSGDDPARLAVVARLLVHMAPIVFLSGATELLNGILIAYDKVAYQYIGRIITLTLSILSLVVLARPAGVLAIVYAAIVAFVVLLIVQIQALRQAGFRYNPRHAPKVDRSFVEMSGAMLAAYGASQLYILLERRTFGGFPAGVLSAFQYGRSLSSIPEQIIIASLTISIWPAILRRTHQGNPSEVFALTARACRYLLWGLAFITLYCEKFGRNLIYLIYFHGAFDFHSLELTELSFAAIILALVPLGINNIVQRGLVSAQRAKSIMLIGFTSAALGSATLLLGLWRRSLPICVLHPFISALGGTALAVALFVRATGVVLAPKMLARYVGYGFRLAGLCLGMYAGYPEGPLPITSKPALTLELAFHSALFFGVFTAVSFFLKLIEVPEIPGKS